MSRSLLIIILALIPLTSMKAQFWIPVGTATFGGASREHAITTHPTTGETYVAFRDLNNSSKVTVMKYDGSNWATVGAAGFTASPASLIDIEINPVTGHPWVSYKNNTAGHLAVYGFDGTSWFSSMDGTYPYEIYDKTLLRFNGQYPHVGFRAAKFNSLGNSIGPQLIVFTNASGIWSYSTLANGNSGDSRVNSAAFDVLNLTDALFDPYAHSRLKRSPGSGSGNVRYFSQFNDYILKPAFHAPRTLSLVKDANGNLYTFYVEGGDVDQNGSPDNVIRYFRNTNPNPFSTIAGPATYASDIKVKYNSSDNRIYMGFINADNQIEVHKLNPDNAEWTKMTMPSTGWAGVTSLRSFDLAINAVSGNVQIVFQDSETTVLSSVLEFVPRTSPQIIYVDKDATGTNDGSSWANAFNHLEDALEYANVAGDEVWVADGTYTFKNSGPNQAFKVNAGISIYGGFIGNETILEQRNFYSNQSIVSADILGNDNSNVVINEATRSDNAYSVFRIYANNVVLDGLVIQGGNASLAYPYVFGRMGSSIFVEDNVTTFTVRNSKIRNNASEIEGGIRFRTTTNSVLNIESCEIYNNVSRYAAAMIATAEPGGSMTVNIINSLIRNNRTYDINTNLKGLAGSAGWIGGNSATVTANIVNCTFAGNTDQGSYLLNGGTTLVLSKNGSGSTTTTINNTIIHSNVVGKNIGPGSWSIPATINLNNSILSDNNTDQMAYATTVNRSNVSIVNPQFLDAGNSDFRLSDGSPAANAGDNALLSNSFTKDVLGNDRVYNTTIDIGAYEVPACTETSINVVSQNVTVYLDASGLASITANQIDNGSATNCGETSGLIYGLNQTSFDCEDLGNNTITLTVSKGALSGSATATVTVVDNIAPAISPSASITVQLGLNGSVEVVPSNFEAFITDNCSTAFTYSMSQSTFDCSDIGSNIVTLFAYDASNNSTSAQVTVVVEDVTGPNLVIQNPTLELNSNGIATLTPALVNNGSTDNCTAAGNLTFGLSKLTFSCADLGANSVTITAYDGAGNQTSGTAIVTVVDNLAPSVLTQNVTLQLDAFGSVELLASSVNNGSTDNCTAGGALILDIDKSDFTCDDLGNNIVTLTVEDASGNISSATATITIEDNIAPNVITKDINVYLDNTGNATIAANQINNGSSDNCTEIGSLVLSLDVTSFTSANIGANTVILTAEDASGNTASAQATVTVVDKTPQNIAFENIADKTYGDVDFDLVATSDSGLPVSFSIINGPATLSGNTLTITGIGDITIEASQAGNDTYGPASVLQTFTVNQAVLTVTANNINIVYGESIPVLTYNYSGFVNGEDQTVLSELPAISTLALNGSNAGTYDITLSGGTALNYTLILVNGTLTISKADQVISIDPISDKLISDASFDIVANTTSGQSLSYTISGPATINGTTITLDGTEGVVTVNVTQSGTINYNSATENVTFNVVDPNQTITFNTLTDMTFGDADFELTATASSGLPVSFTSSNASVATINGNVVTIVGAGSTTITASQIGNELFNAAPDIQQSFTVNKAQQTIIFNPIDAQIFETGSVSLSATASSGLVVEFEVVDGPATLNGNVVSFDGLGMVTLQAIQSGNNNYEAATNVEQVFDVITVTEVDDELEKVSVQLYPNPVASTLNLIGLSEVQEVQIINLNGILIESVAPVSDEISLNVENYINGHYILRIKSVRGVHNLRFVKQ